MGIFFSSLSLSVCARVSVLGIVVKLQQENNKKETLFVLIGIADIILEND